MGVCECQELLDGGRAGQVVPVSECVSEKACLVLRVKMGGSWDGTRFLSSACDSWQMSAIEAGTAADQNGMEDQSAAGEMSQRARDTDLKVDRAVVV